MFWYASHILNDAILRKCIFADLLCIYTFVYRWCCKLHEMYWSTHKNLFWSVQCVHCELPLNVGMQERHTPICAKSSQKKRKVFDSTKQRAQGTDIKLTRSRPKPGQAPPVSPRMNLVQHNVWHRFCWQIGTGVWTVTKSLLI